MEAWYANGAITVAILAAMALEAAILTILYRQKGRGVPPALLLPNLAAGACLIAAAGAALRGAWWGWVGTLLLAGLAFHLIDLRAPAGGNAFLPPSLSSREGPGVGAWDKRVIRPDEPPNNPNPPQFPPITQS